MHIISRVLLGSASLATLMTTAPALAQQGQSSGIADIVVTARRQAESMQRIPVAVTAMTADKLTQMNALQVDKIADAAPNLTIAQQPTAMGAATVNMRGIGQTDPSMGLDTAVGIYLDGVYVARTAGAIFDLVDVDRIEVLAGPQGTLFGRNSTGGAIQIISKKPAEDLGLTAQAGYGSRNSVLARARFDTGRMGGGPLSAAFTFQHRQKDGNFDNTYTDGLHDPGSLIANSFRAQLSGDFDALKLDYSFDFDDRKGGEAYFQVVALSPDAANFYGNSVNLGGAPIIVSPQEHRLKSGTRAPTGNPRPGYSPFMANTRSWGHNLTMTLDLSEALTLKSITGYRGMEMNNSMNMSGSDVMLGVVLPQTGVDPATKGPIFGAPTVERVYMYGGYNGPQPQKQFSEELQLSGQTGDFKYVGGLYYFWERGSEVNNQLVTAIVPDTGGAIGLNVPSTQQYVARTRSYAAYGQVSYRPAALDHKLELTAGVRYTKDKKKIHLLDSAFGVSTVTGPAFGEKSFNNVSWLGSLSYDITDSIMAYAKVSTAYQAGGFNPRSTFLNAFEPQKVTSVEAGVKSEFFDRRMRFNIDGYWMRYTDLQIQQFVSGSGGAVTEIVNAGKATFKGIEAELTVIPVTGLTLSGSLGYNDPKYNQFLFRDPSTGALSDIAKTAHFQASPKLTTNVNVNYAFPPMDFGQLHANFTWAHRSQMLLYPNDAVNPFNYDVRVPTQDTLSVRIALSEIPLSGRAVGEIAFTGDNLTNQDQIAYGIDFGGLGFGGVTYKDPRTFGVQFKVTY